MLLKPKKKRISNVPKKKRSLERKRNELTKLRWETFFLLQNGAQFPNVTSIPAKKHSRVASYLLHKRDLIHSIPRKSSCIAHQKYMTNTPTAQLHFTIVVIATVHGHSVTIQSCALSLIQCLLHQIVMQKKLLKLCLNKISRPQHKQSERLHMTLITLTRLRGTRTCSHLHKS